MDFNWNSAVLKETSETVNTMHDALVLYQDAFPTGLIGLIQAGVYLFDFACHISCTRAFRTSRHTCGVLTSMVLTRDYCTWQCWLSAP